LRSKRDSRSEKAGKQPPGRNRIRPPLTNVLPKLSAIKHLVPLAMFCLDAQGRVTSWNKAAEQLLGWTEAETLGRELPYVPAGSEQESDALWRRVMQGEESLGTEIRRVRKDGRPVYLQLWTTIIKDEAGAFVGTLGLLADISHRKRAEATKSIGEQHWRTLIDAEPECVKITSADGLLLDMNPAGLAMIEADALEQIRGRSILPIVAPEHREVFAAFIQRAANGQPGRLQFQIVGLKGTRRWMETHAVPFGNERGEQATVLAIAHDVTERKRAEEALRESERRLSLVLDATSEGIWDWNVKTGHVYFSPQWIASLGYAPEEVPPHVSFWESIIHPDDKPRVQETLRAHFEGRTSFYACENRLREKSGRWRINLDRGKVVERDADGRPVRMVGSDTDITERKRAEDALHESERALNALVSNLPGVVYRCQNDPDWTVSYISDQVRTLLGYPPHEFYSKGIAWAHRTHPDDRERIWNEVQSALSRREPFSFEYRMQTRDDRKVWVWEQGEGVYAPDGTLAFLEGFVIDITERKHLEESLRQAQKMEAVGRLAGGIAHDFNNMLTVIGGCSDLVQRRIDPQDPLSRYIQDIKAASDRAAELTRQLLAYSRRQVMETRVLSLNGSILAMESMLRRLIGEHIELTLDLSPDLGAVKADPGQIEQVIMNLTLNARDSMPNGGRLTIATVNAAIDQGNAGTLPNVHVPPGAYSQLIVSDTGQGMDKFTLTHLFEPFFTTKEVGKGTGLGLATVYGIVAQSGGVVWASSEPGEGATFTVCLPHVAQAPEPPIPSAATPRSPRGSETILLAEDEESVRALAREVLQRQGYRVLEARNGVDALALATQHAGPIHLLLTDLVMPEMDGHALARRLTSDRRELKVLIMSGYTDDTNLQRGIFDVRAAFIPKPMRIETLLKKVRDVLEDSS